MREEPELGGQGRKLTPSMLDGGGVSLERLPSLAYALEQFSAALSEAMTPLFGESGSGSTAELRNVSLFEALGERLGRQFATLRSESFDHPILLVFPSDIGDFLVASTFGGVRTERAAEAPFPQPTAIEMRLIEEFARGLAKALEIGFSSVAKLAFTVEPPRRLADAQVLGRRDMPVTTLRIAYKSAAGDCECDAVLPHANLTSLRRELSREPPTDAPAADGHWIRQLHERVSETRMPVTAILEEMSMTLGDIARLQVGAVVALRGSGLGRVRLECGGHGVFWGNLDSGEGRYAITVGEPIIGEPTA
jgi:flagellar motor switch protein FliM